MTINRRSLITGLISFAVTAPAIVRAASLMPVKVMTAEELSENLINTLYQTWDLGKDQGTRITYMYMVDGSIKIEQIDYMDIYK